MLSETLSVLDKLNYDKNSKYQLCWPKIDMAHVYVLIFKIKSDLDKLNHVNY